MRFLTWNRCRVLELLRVVEIRRFGESWSRRDFFSKIFFFKIFFFQNFFFGMEVGNPGVVSVGVGVSSTLGAT